MYLLIFFLIPKILLSIELDLICTNKYSILKEVDVKDVFLLLDSETKKIDLGGLSFYADDFSITKSNISWNANNISIYPESNGEISGILGRYSGDLVLKFKRNDENRERSLVFNCRKFELRKRKF